MRSTLLLTLACFVPATFAADPSRADLEHFEKHVRPLLVDKCMSCHGPKAQRGSLRVDSREHLLRGGDSGPALLPGKPDQSLLLRAVRHQGDLKMPPKVKDRLDDNAIAHLARWVQVGAPWPASVVAAPTESAIALARKTHWAFRPVVRPAVPQVTHTGWGTSPVDRFVLARLQAKNLTPSTPAARATLLRRVSFGLTGLPPTPEEVDRFLADPRPDAWERVVERLLASPAYGERWGRHWLDIARYADTKGYVFQEERRYPYSYTYRDWVVQAFNDDLPYDQFILQQLAADQLPGANRQAMAAMGFLTLGRRFLNNTHDIIDDRIDVTTRGLMGLTVGCARCHDHKYDPVPTRDYYSLYGVFASSVEPGELPLLEEPDPTQRSTPFEVELQARQARLDELTTREREVVLTRLRARASDALLAASGGPAGEVSQPVLQRWRAFLARAGKGHDPVLAPWLAFARLPAADFAQKAGPLARQIADNTDPKKPINAHVASLFAGQAPRSLAEVATRYGELFKRVDQAWQAQVKAGKASKLDDAALEAVRQVLYADGSPTNIPPGEIRRFLDRAQRNRIQALQQKVDQWRAKGKGAIPRAMVLVDAPAPTNPVVFVRGNPANRGVAVPRQFLEVLDPARRPFDKGSGRLDLARAIASRDNPLTARVLVNRLWMHHFGQGLVRTPGDFGTRGDAPTHPELLDWLADELVRSNWSIKHVQRLILLSSVYRQASDDREDMLAADPDNALLWRMNRRRLEFEPLRDALLATAGKLDRQMRGPGIDITVAPYPPRRSVYAFIERQNLPGVFRTFDLASPDASTPQRHSTTVPQQSLFLMNSPFLHDLARSLAARPELAGARDDAERVRRMHELAYGRPADPEEIRLAMSFLATAGKSGTGSLSAWEQYAQVVLLANEFAFVD